MSAHVGSTAGTITPYDAFGNVDTRTAASKCGLQATNDGNADGRNTQNEHKEKAEVSRCNHAPLFGVTRYLKMSSNIGCKSAKKSTSPMAVPCSTSKLPGEENNRTLRKQDADQEHLTDENIKPATSSYTMSNSVSLLRRDRLPAMT